MTHCLTTTEIGTCYLFVGSPRNTLFRDLAKFLRLNVTFKTNKDPHYLEAFPLHKAPVFESKDGWKLHEAICIADYFVSLKPADCTYNFFGHSERDRAIVVQWISFSFSDCVMAFVLLMIAKDGKQRNQPGD
ncbi:DEKNAAC104553 [Brettanomyces naardenensis]|uniref:DEKNAAC104553 n=1 Tax=Brettanomyces naardenensis TaxID=13370 RepID=A0A448YRF4_BRENA|nr:DEKNAAC104553 [Brettanomyces naardenensis]